jgi:hypothetical protein
MNVQCPYCNHEWANSEKSICQCPSCQKSIICPSSERSKPHEILQDIIGACGVQILCDKIQLQGYLADITQNKIIRKIILLAINDNIHGKLFNNSINDIKIESVKYFFATQNFLYKEIADYIVDSFAYALGVKDNIDLSKLKDDWFTDTSNKNNFSVYKKVEPTAILDFSIIDDKVIENQPFTIQYKTLNANRAYINNEEISINKSEYKIQISAYKQFTLTVENEHYKETQTLEVQPVKLPQIVDFKASETHIKSGDKVVLSWNVADANCITIKYDNQEIDVSNRCDLDVTQTNTMQYELVAHTVNDSYSISEKIKIVVIKPAKILLFQTNKERIVESDKILLTWQVSNANKILLFPLQKDVTKLTQIEILPTQTENYCLQVSNELFTEEKNISVYVYKLPVINKILLPEIPSFNIKLPNVSFDTTYKPSILKQMQKASWYNNLFSLQFKTIYILINNILTDFDKRFFNIINTIKR